MGHKPNCDISKPLPEFLRVQAYSKFIHQVFYQAEDNAVAIS
jgi:hypothetical protein